MPEGGRKRLASEFLAAVVGCRVEGQFVSSKPRVAARSLFARSISLTFGRYAMSLVNLTHAEDDVCYACDRIRESHGC